MPRIPVRLLAGIAALALVGACNTDQSSTQSAEQADVAGAELGYSDVPSQLLYGITSANRLVSFDASKPCQLLSRQVVTGLQPEEEILGIDFRPATGGLYGLGSTSRLYLIDPGTAVATQVGSGPFATALEGHAFGFDFNPTVDRIRVVSNTGQNLRLNPITGALAAVDTALAFAALDPNAGARPAVVGAAYTNPDNDPATGTTLYDIDAALDLLVTQAPPNGGVLNTVGRLGERANGKVGFDIGADGRAWAVLKPGGRGGRRCGPSALYTIDLATGEATRVGFVGTRTPLKGLAAVLR